MQFRFGVVDLGIELDLFFYLGELVIICDILLRFRFQVLVRVACIGCRRGVRLVAIDRDLVRCRKLVDHLHNCACVCAVDDLDRVFRTGVGSGFGALLVHRRPCAFAAADIQGITRLDRNERGPAVFCTVFQVIVEVDPRLIVLIGCRRRHLEVRGLVRDRQCVFTGLAVKGRRKRAAADRKVLQSRIGIIPCTAEVYAEILGEHDVDLIAVLELAVLIAEFLETEVGEPVV